MKEIKLTKGQFAIVDDEDFEWLNQWKWCISGGYASRTIYTESTPRRIFMHVLIKRFPKNKEVDHINGNKLDNRRSNLRICTTSQNQFNSKLNQRNTSGYKGVSFNKRMNKWQVYMQISKKPVYLGCYPTKIEAARVYDSNVLRYRGDFAKTNSMLGL